MEVSSLLIILFFTFTLNSNSLAYSNEAKSDDLLSKQYIINKMDVELIPNFRESDFTVYSKKHLVFTKDLFDINGNKYVIFLKYSNENYAIYDYRVSGFGILESGEISALLNINDKLNRDKLYYIFPSQILTEEEKNNIVSHEFKGNSQSEVLPLNDEYKNLNLSVNSYIEDSSFISYKAGDYDVARIRDDMQFLGITDGSKKYYGGNQSWFTQKDLKNRGCGTVSAENITAYMSKVFSSKKNLYSRGELTKVNFIKHMYDVEKYLSPSIIGVPTLGAFENGIEKFAKSRGVSLNAFWSDNKVNKTTFTNYIKSGLRANYPVAYLQYYNSNQKQYNWHWMTITKYFKNLRSNNTSIIVSTWGGKQILNFDALWSGNLACGVLYFK
ncbi:MAG: hypothetical protein Q4B23_04920 [Helcococcus sp.]|nr:hypothetical protein [Helcococcus sp.]